MLEELHVRDLALIEDVTLELGPGLTALTGETGAGKTALVGAIKLLVGERADSQAVRAGAKETLIEGRFHSDGEVVVARRVGADGRSRCSIDSEMATVGALASRVGPLVDLHGQHEHQALLAPGTHVGYLDRWGGGESARLLDAFRAALHAWRAAKRAREALLDRMEQAKRDVDYLRFVVAEIDVVDPKPGEDEELEAMLPLLEHGEKLADIADQVSRGLRGEGGALDTVSMVLTAAEKLAGLEPAMDALIGRIREVQAVLDDLGVSAREYRDRVETDPAALDATHTRLAALQGLMKRYGPRLEDVIKRREDALSSLSAFESGDEELASLDVRLAEATTELQRVGDALSLRREGLTQGFTSALAEACADLAMGGATFDIGLTGLPMASWGEDGPQRVEFLYSPAPGQPHRQLAKIASGGELSRVMLALKSVLGSADEVETLVFDEVDAGIGGSTATAIGRRLAELARDRQVIVITHLAQVAAFADAQLVVSKSVSSEGVSTRVKVVDGAARVREIARMLSGDESEASIDHARELMSRANA